MIALGLTTAIKNGKHKKAPIGANFQPRIEKSVSDGKLESVIEIKRNSQTIGSGFGRS